MNKIVGQSFNNYTVTGYEGKNEGKHYYTIRFDDSGNEYVYQERSKVRNGKCKDLIAIKLANSKQKQEKFKKKFALSKKSTEHYERIPDIDSKVVMALDASTNCTGYCIYQYGLLVAKGEIKPDKNLETPFRMKYMQNKISELIALKGVEVIFYEDVIFKNVNVMKILGRLQGMIESMAIDMDSRFILINPSSWKNYCGFTGKREEQKAQSIAKASSELGIKMGEDEADAYNLMQYCLYINRKAEVA